MAEIREFDHYQKEAHKTASYLDKIDNEFPDLPEKVRGLLELSYVSNGLGEVGEIQGKIKKLIRDKAGEITEKDELEIIKEAGDCLWYLSELAHILGYNLQQVAELNIKKLTSRKERGVIGGSGDNR